MPNAFIWAGSSRLRPSSTRGRAKGFVMPLRPRRPRLRLDPESYRRLCRHVLERDRWRCQLCGRTVELQVQHIKPRSRLGDDALQNLIAVCAKCHDDLHRQRRG